MRPCLKKSLARNHKDIELCCILKGLRGTAAHGQVMCPGAGVHGAVSHRGSSLSSLQNLPSVSKSSPSETFQGCCQFHSPGVCTRLKSMLPCSSGHGSRLGTPCHGCGKGVLLTSSEQWPGTQDTAAGVTLPEWPQRQRRPVTAESHCLLEPLPGRCLSEPAYILSSSDLPRLFLALCAFGMCVSV